MYASKKLAIHNDPHGVREDHYAWMSERDSPDVLSFLKSHEYHANNALRGCRAKTARIQNEIMHRADRDDMSVPVFYDGFYYYTRTVKGANYAVHCRRPTLNSPEQVVFDEDEFAAGFDYYSSGGYAVSPDGKTLAYAEDTQGNRLYKISFLDIETREPWALTIPDTHANMVWSEDGQFIYYAVPDPHTLRTHRIYRQYMNANALPVLIFEENNVQCTVSIGRSRDKEYLIILSWSTDSTVTYLLPLKSHDTTPFHFIGSHDSENEYTVDHMDGRFYVIAYEQGSKNGRFLCFDGIDAKERELIPPRPGVYLEDVELFTDMCAWEERANGQERLYYASWSALEAEGISARKEIRIPHEVYSASLVGNAIPGTQKIRFVYESPVDPGAVYELNTRTGNLDRLKRVDIPQYDEREYVCKRVWVPSRDGKTKIPMVFSCHRTVQFNGSAPGIINGYGSYGICNTPTFSIRDISLMDRGFVVACAQIRGGSELGHEWYDQGRKLNKWNTFNDFIDCSEYLIHQKICSKNKLTAMGGSAGGLLMGVILNERPELYRAIVAQVPFVDALTTMLDDSIPLTTLEYNEWGNPNEKEFYDYIRSYSPYDNIKRQAIPHLLVVSGYHDSQVQYWEPAKWVAKLREYRTNGNHLILKMSMSGGHQSKSGLSAIVEETAQEFAFLINATHS